MLRPQKSAERPAPSVGRCKPAAEAAPSSPAVAIFLWGAASFAFVPPLQVRVMAAAFEAPNLASAMNIGAFNLGNAIGAALGGAVIAGSRTHERQSADDGEARR